MKNIQMVMNSFMGINEGVIKNDYNMITKSLSDICYLFGEDVAFKTTDDFLKFWNDPKLIMEI